MKTPPIEIRAETDTDHAAIHAVNAAAFETAAEARLVSDLRSAGAAAISLVARRDRAIVGHILFSPVTFDGTPDAEIWLALGPMAVLPAHQRQGIGSALVRAGLERCRARGVPVVCVLGHPGFYPRFGFRPSAPLGIGSEYDVPEEAFMVHAINGKALEGARGTVRYHAAFDGV